MQFDTGVPYLSDFYHLVRSTDNGVMFTLSDTGLSGTFTSMAIDPEHPARLFAVFSTGLYKTEDAGTSWSLLDPGGETVVRTLGMIVITPKKPNLIYLGGSSLLEVEIEH